MGASGSGGDPSHLVRQIVDLFHHSRNIHQKRQLDPILEKVRTLGYASDRVYASLGEDAAAIRLHSNRDDLVLLTTDAILPEFIEKNPYAAGFSAVYVGLDDIYACGGLPTAFSITMEYHDPQMGDQVLQGVLDASQRFRLPLVRGHTVTDANRPGLTSTMIGSCSIPAFISFKDAQAGDAIALVYDAEGQPGALNHLYWNTILNQPADRFLNKRGWIAHAKAHGWIHACKDISNGGILGTLAQFLSYAQKGAHISIDPLYGTPFLQM